MKPEKTKTQYFEGKLSDKTLSSVNKCLVNDCLKLKPKKKNKNDEKYFKKNKDKK